MLAPQEFDSAPTESAFGGALMTSGQCLGTHTIKFTCKCQIFTQSGIPTRYKISSKNLSFFFKPHLSSKTLLLVHSPTWLPKDSGQDFILNS